MDSSKNFSPTPSISIGIDSLPSISNNELYKLIPCETNSGTKQFDYNLQEQILDKLLYSQTFHTHRKIASMQLDGFALQNMGTINKADYADFCEKFLSYNQGEFVENSDGTIAMHGYGKWAKGIVDDTPLTAVNAGLPNITGTIINLIHKEDEPPYAPQGVALYNRTDTGGDFYGVIDPFPYAAVNNKDNISFDASKSNGLYGDSAEVSPAGYTTHPYLYIGQYVGTKELVRYACFDEATRLFTGFATLLGINGLNKKTMSLKIPSDKLLKKIATNKELGLIFKNDTYSEVNLKELWLSLAK